MLGAEIARDVPVSDELGIEVVANGLPLWRAPQTPPSGARSLFAANPHPRADVQPGTAVSAAAQRKRHQT